MIIINKREAREAGCLEEIKKLGETTRLMRRRPKRIQEGQAWERKKERKPLRVIAKKDREVLRELLRKDKEVLRELLRKGKEVRRELSQFDGPP